MTTVKRYRKKLDGALLSCLAQHSIAPIVAFVDWAESRDIPCKHALPSTPLAVWGAIHKMITESVGLRDHWQQSEAWLRRHHFAPRLDWDAVGRGAEARSLIGQAFGLRSAEEASQ